MTALAGETGLYSTDWLDTVGQVPGSRTRDLEEQRPSSRGKITASRQGRPGASRRGNRLKNIRAKSKATWRGLSSDRGVDTLGSL